MIKRGIMANLLQCLEEDAVVFLKGPRQAGKSTLVKSLLDRSYLTLDDLVILNAARDNPQGFIEGLSGRVTLDEVQRVPEILLPIKRAVDQERRVGEYLLTGSADMTALPSVADTLAGRMSTLTLLPFSQSEIGEGAFDLIGNLMAVDPWKPQGIPQSHREIASRIVRGGFPEAVARKSIEGSRRWLRSYVQTIIERDLLEVARVEDVGQVFRLLALLASRSATLLNFSDISRVLGAPQTTLKRHIALLETVFLISLIPAWSGGMTARLSRQAKIIMGDTGLACVVAGVDEEGLLNNPVMLGQMLETLVAGELAKAATWSSEPVSLLHFRSHDQREVDLVIEGPGGRVCGIEVKLSGAVNGDDFRGLRRLREVAGDRFHHGYLVYAGGTSVPFESNLTALPLSALFNG